MEVVVVRFFGNESGFIFGFFLKEGLVFWIGCFWSFLLIIGRGSEEGIFIVRNEC